MPELGRHSRTADRGYSFRICPGLIPSVLRILPSLCSLQGQPHSQAQFPFHAGKVLKKLPMLLGQERENSYKLQLGRNLASDPPRWISCSSLPLYPFRFTGASWAIEQGQGPEAWLLQPQPQEPRASRRLVSAQQRSRCLYLQAFCAASRVCRQRLSGNSRHLKHSVPGPLTTSGWQPE